MSAITTQRLLLAIALYEGSVRRGMVDPTKRHAFQSLPPREQRIWMAEADQLVESHRPKMPVVDEVSSVQDIADVLEEQSEGGDDDDA